MVFSKLLKRSVIGATIFLVGSTVYLTLFVYFQRQKCKHIPGPKENGLIEFFVGQTFKVAREFKNGKTSIQQLTELIDIYGPVVKINVFNRTVVHTTDLDAIKEILVGEDFHKFPNTYRRIGFPLGVRFLGNGLLTETDKNKWYDRRVLFNTGFQKHELKNFMEDFNSKGNNLVEKLRTQADGKTAVTLLTEFNRAALDVIACVAFGMDVDSINDSSIKFNQEITEAMKLLNFAFLDPFAKYKPSNWKAIRKIKESIGYLRKVGKDQILERIRALEKGESLPNDILTTILRSHYSEKIDLDAMVDDFITFFIAGQETTSSSLAFCFLELCKNPECMIKIQHEIDEVIGSKHNITYEDIGQLKYTSMVFKETLRLWNPAQLISRLTTKPMTINGYHIPVGVLITASSNTTARCAKYFDDPLAFKPERFFKNPDTNKSTIPSYAYFPFSLGTRSCIGQNFAQIEVKLLIAKLIQNFNIKLDPTQSFNVKQLGTLRPEDGTRCFLTMRDH